MNKKQLQELLAAKRVELSALLTGAETAENPIEALAAVTAKRDEVTDAENRLTAKEALEAHAKSNALLSAKSAGATAHNLAEDRPFKSSGDFFAAVILAGKAAMLGGEIDPRLQKLGVASGVNESVSSEGGFLVGTDQSAELLTRVYETGQLASKCRQIPISAGANGTKINGVDETSRASGSRYGGIRGYWASEASTVASSQPKFRKIELTLKKLMALVYATEEQLADSLQLQAFINEAVPSELAFLMDDAILSGLGAGQPLGILTMGAGTGFVSQAAEAAQTAATVNSSNVAKMLGRMLASSAANAEWFINQDVFSQLPLMSIANQPIFTPPGGFSASPYGTLLGKPINVIEQASTLGTVGDIGLLDLSQYALATKGGVNSAASMHVRFLYDEQVFKFTMRVDGQPMHNSVLTPFKGSNTQSPFVFLAAR